MEKTWPIPEKQRCITYRSAARLEACSHRTKMQRTHEASHRTPQAVQIPAPTGPFKLIIAGFLYENNSHERTREAP